MHITKAWLTDLLGQKYITKEQELMEDIKNIVMAKHGNPRAYIVWVTDDEGGHKGEQYFIKDGRKEKINKVAALREAEFSAFSEKAPVSWDKIKDLVDGKMLAKN